MLWINISDHLFAQSKHKKLCVKYLAAQQTISRMEQDCKILTEQMERRDMKYMTHLLVVTRMLLQMERQLIDAQKMAVVHQIKCKLETRKTRIESHCQMKQKLHDESGQTSSQGEMLHFYLYSSEVEHY